MKSRIPDARLTVFSQFDEMLAGTLKSEDLEVDTIKTKSVLSVIRSLATADLFVIVGGPFYEGPAQSMVAFGLVSIARMFRVPVMTYGATAYSC